MVVVEAKHMCMQMRGVEKQNSITTTSDFTGAFNQAKTREEFMNLIQHGTCRENLVRNAIGFRYRGKAGFGTDEEGAAPMKTYLRIDEESSQNNPVTQSFCHDALYGLQLIKAFHKRITFFIIMGESRILQGIKHVLQFLRYDCIFEVNH